MKYGANDPDITTKILVPGSCGDARASAAVESSHNYVFLDIDGVLCVPQRGRGLTEECMHTLCTLVHKANARVVVSSSWRLDRKKFRKIVNALADIGLSVHDSTREERSPAAPSEQCSDDEDDFASQRAREILHYVQSHSAEVAAFVALDDLNLTTKLPPHTCVVVDGLRGLQEDDSDSALRLFELQRHPA